MFTEEMAREIGIAYTLYCLDCEKKGIGAKSPIEFTELTTSKIEQIRECKGLSKDNDVCG